MRLRGSQLDAINAALKSGTAEDFNAALQKTCEQVEGIGQFAAARGSANSSPAKEALKKEIAKIIDDAFTAGFDADNAGALDHFDGFALAEAAIEKHWLNDQAQRPG